MTLTQIAPPYPIFTDKNGDPLDAGYLYFGTANLNPETNPITVYYDRGLTQPAAQPLRTSNGYVMRNGSPALIYANDQFSVTVRNKNNELVIYSPVGFGIVPGVPIQTFDNAANNVTELLANTQFTYTAGIPGTVQVVAGDILRTLAEGFAYEVAASGATNQHVTTAGGVKLYVLPDSSGWYNFAALGPVADGVTNDYPKFEKLLSIRLANGTSTNPKGASIFVPSGNYYMDAGANGIQLKAVTNIRGEATGQNNASIGSRFTFPVGCVGITCNRFNTLNGGIEAVPTGGADGSVIEGIAFVSTVDNNKASHAIWLRARAVVTRCFIRDWGGNGVNIVASATGSAAEIGNANNFRLDSIRIQGCEHAVYVDGVDANAGEGYSIDASNNRRWGVFDSSFLGNEWTNCHTAINGSDTTSGLSAYATFGGASYHAVPTATEQQFVDTQPGTNDSIWRECSSSNGQIAWTGGQALGTYRSGGGYYSDNNNARCSFVGCYAEGGQGLTWLSQNSLAVGGFLVTVPVVAGAALEARQGDLWTRQGVVSEDTSASNGRTTYAEIGGNAGNGDVLRFEATDSGGALPTGTWRLRKFSDHFVFTHSNLDARIAAGLLGPGGVVPYSLWAPRIVLGASIANSRQITYMTAAPTTGTWIRGDIVFNRDPSAGGKIGWVCVTGGTPGTWKTFGAIDP